MTPNVATTYEAIQKITAGGSDCTPSLLAATLWINCR